MMKVLLMAPKPAIYRAKTASVGDHRFTEAGCIKAVYRVSQMSPTSVARQYQGRFGWVARAFAWCVPLVPCLLRLTIWSSFILFTRTEPLSAADNPSWLIERSSNFTTLQRKAPKSVERDLKWTENNSEIPILTQVMWIFSGGKKLFIAEIVPEPLNPDWRIFDESGRLIGALSFYSPVQHCMGHIGKRDVVSIYGARLTLGVVSQDARDARSTFDYDDMDNQWSSRFQLIEIRPSGLNIQTAASQLKTAKSDAKRGCSASLKITEGNRNGY